MKRERVAVWLYRQTLYLYPPGHRREWGEVMAVTFEEMCRDAQQDSGFWGVLSVWLRAFVDTLVSATVEYVQPKERLTMEHPKTIKQYQVQATLEDDTFSRLYHVHDSQGRDAVLRLFPQEDMHNTHEKEIANLERVQHPAAPRLLDKGTFQQQPFSVVEYIHGKDWLRLLQEQPEKVTEEAVIAWAIEVCDFLHYLHEQDTPLIHRSLKPEHLMVQNDGRVRVLDYGIMEAYREEQGYPLIGTIGYSPPEQYVGRSDARSDIYSLGASLYHILTCRDPRKDTAFLFHFRPPRSVNATISPALEEVILRATEHKPGDRYQSATAMKVALQACLHKDRNGLE